MTEDEAKAVQQGMAESYYRGTTDTLNSMRQAVDSLREGTLLTKEDAYNMIESLREISRNLFGPTEVGGKDGMEG